MNAIDLVLKIAALGGLGFFLGIVASYVPEPALLIVFGVVYLMALYDILVWGRSRR